MKALVGRLVYPGRLGAVVRLAAGRRPRIRPTDDGSEIFRTMHAVEPEPDGPIVLEESGRACFLFRCDREASPSRTIEARRLFVRTRRGRWIDEPDEWPVPLRLTASWSEVPDRRLTHRRQARGSNATACCAARRDGPRGHGVASKGRWLAPHGTRQQSRDF